MRYINYIIIWIVLNQKKNNKLYFKDFEILGDCGKFTVLCCQNNDVVYWS